MTKRKLLNKRRKKVLEIAREQGHIDAQTYRSEFPHWSVGTQQRDFRLLVEAGLLVKHSDNKGAYYTPAKQASG